MKNKDYPDNKNQVLVYILWFFLGLLGIHRFYLGWFKSGIAQLLLAIIVIATLGHFPLAALTLIGWWVLDVFVVHRHFSEEVQSSRENESEPTHFSNVSSSDIQRFNTLTDQYIACFERDDIDGAIAGCGQTLTLCETMFGKDDSRAADLRNVLGKFYLRKGNTHQAIVMIKSAIVILEKLSDNSSLCDSVKFLAITYDNLGQSPEAETLYLRVIELLDSGLIEKTEKYFIDYLTTINNLAHIYREQEKNAKAMALYDKALPFLDHLTNDQTELKVDILRYYASTRARRGDHLEKSYAIKSYKDAISLLEASGNESGLQMAFCRNGLGIIYTQYNQMSDAERELNSAIAIRKKLSSLEDPDFLIVLSNLALVYCNQKRFSKAEAIGKHIVQCREKSLGENHPNTLEAKRNLAYVRDQLSNASILAITEKLEIDISPMDKIELGARFIQLVSWGDAALAEICVHRFKENFKLDDTNIQTALQNSLSELESHRDWNELELVLEDWKSIATKYQIPGRINTCTKEEFDFEDAEDFYNKAENMLNDEGYRTWIWETGGAEYRTFITRSRDEEIIKHIKNSLKLNLL